MNGNVGQTKVNFGHLPDCIAYILTPSLGFYLHMGETFRVKVLLKVDPNRLLTRMPSLTGTDSLTERLYICVFWDGRLPRQLSIHFFSVEASSPHIYTVKPLFGPVIRVYLLACEGRQIWWVLLQYIMGIDNLQFYTGKRFGVQNWHTRRALIPNSPISLSLVDGKWIRSRWEWGRNEERESKMGIDKGIEVTAGFRKQTVTPTWLESTIIYPLNNNHVSKSLKLKTKCKKLAHLTRFV